MQPKVSHVAWSVCLSVCVLGTRVSCAKTAEAIEMPFGGLSQVGQRNHALDGVPNPQWEGAHLREIYAGQLYVMYLHQSNVPGLCTRIAFAAATGDKTAMRPFATVLWALVLHQSSFE